MTRPGFEWDETKNATNRAKRGLSFEQARAAFSDPRRVIARDLAHKRGEKRDADKGTSLALSRPSVLLSNDRVTWSRFPEVFRIRFNRMCSSKGGSRLSRTSLETIE